MGNPTNDKPVVTVQGMEKLTSWASVADDWRVGAREALIGKLLPIRLDDRLAERFHSLTFPDLGLLDHAWVRNPLAGWAFVICIARRSWCLLFSEHLQPSAWIWSKGAHTSEHLIHKKSSSLFGPSGFRSGFKMATASAVGLSECIIAGMQLAVLFRRSRSSYRGSAIVLSSGSRRMGRWMDCWMVLCTLWRYGKSTASKSKSFRRVLR